MKPIWILGAIATTAAIVVSVQAIEFPFASREVVQEISDRAIANSRNHAVYIIESLDGQLLQNQIDQGVFVRDGEPVPAPYLHQEQMFQHKIAEQERILNALPKQ